MSAKAQRSRQQWVRRSLSFVFILFIIAFGTSLSIRANLGSSPISAPPYVLSLIPGMKLTMGQLTILMHIFFITTQVVLLGKDFDKLQFTQILVSFLFGLYTDVTMWLTGFMQVPFDLNPYWGYPLRLAELLAGGAILALGIACEVRCDSFLLAGEGFPLAIAKCFKKDFGKVKMCTDTGLVAVGVIIMFCYFGHWDWKLIGLGTLVSMFYVGAMVRVIAPHIAWLDRIFIPASERALLASEEAEEEGDAADAPLVVTIARQYGSGGHIVGQKLAQRLHLKYIDRELIDDTAQALGDTTDFVAKSEQNISTSKLWQYILADDSIPPSMNPSHDDAIYVSQSRVIREMASQGPCVIIGRLANWVLRDRRHVLRVFVTSSEDYAFKRVAAELHLGPAEARKKIEEVNRGRANHYWEYTGRQWTDACGYDLVVSTSTVGIDGAVDIIAHVAKHHPHLQPAATHSPAGEINANVEASQRMKTPIQAQPGE